MQIYLYIYLGKKFYYRQNRNTSNTLNCSHCNFQRYIYIFFWRIDQLKDWWSLKSSDQSWIIFHKVWMSHKWKILQLFVCCCLIANANGCRKNTTNRQRNPPKYEAEELVTLTIFQLYSLIWQESTWAGLFSLSLNSRHHK